MRQAQLALLTGTQAPYPLPDGVGNKDRNSKEEGKTDSGRQESDAAPVTTAGGDGARGREWGGAKKGIQAIAIATCPAKSYAHPYYWAPFILMGNWK